MPQPLGARSPQCSGSHGLGQHARRFHPRSFATLVASAVVVERDWKAAARDIPLRERANQPDRRVPVLGAAAMSKRQLEGSNNSGFIHAGTAPCDHALPAYGGRFGTVIAQGDIAGAARQHAYAVLCQFPVAQTQYLRFGKTFF